MTQVLDRSGDGHMRFIGGTIYCPNKPGRLNLGAKHEYGDEFICPECGAVVPHIARRVVRPGWDRKAQEWKK